MVHEDEGGGQRPRPARATDAPHERHWLELGLGLRLGLRLGLGSGFGLWLGLPGACCIAAASSAGGGCDVYLG